MGPGLGDGEPLSERIARDALKALEWHWDGAYAFSVKGGTWTAERADGLGVITAGSATELADRVQADYMARPVPR